MAKDVASSRDLQFKINSFLTLDGWIARAGTDKATAQYMQEEGWEALNANIGPFDCSRVRPRPKDGICDALGKRAFLILCADGKKVPQDRLTPYAQEAIEDQRVDFDNYQRNFSADGRFAFVWTRDEVTKKSARLFYKGFFLPRMWMHDIPASRRDAALKVALSYRNEMIALMLINEENVRPNNLLVHCLLTEDQAFIRRAIQHGAHFSPLTFKMAAEAGYTWLVRLHFDKQILDRKVHCGLIDVDLVFERCHFETAILLRNAHMALPRFAEFMFNASIGATDRMNVAAIPDAQKPKLPVAYLWAIDGGQEETVAFLIQAGVPIHPDALLAAAKDGAFNIVERLIRRVPYNLQVEYMDAAKLGDLNILQLHIDQLRKQGTPLSSESLIWAAHAPDPEPVAEALLNAGVVPNDQVFLYFAREGMIDPILYLKARGFVRSPTAATQFEDALYPYLERAIEENNLVEIGKIDSLFIRGVPFSIVRYAAQIDRLDVLDHGLSRIYFNENDPNDRSNLLQYFMIRKNRHILPHLDKPAIKLLKSMPLRLILPILQALHKARCLAIGRGSLVNEFADVLNQAVDSGDIVRAKALHALFTYGKRCYIPMSCVIHAISTGQGHKQQVIDFFKSGVFYNQRDAQERVDMLNFIEAIIKTGDKVKISLMVAVLKSIHKQHHDGMLSLEFSNLAYRIAISERKPEAVAILLERHLPCSDANKLHAQEVGDPAILALLPKKSKE